MAARELTLKFSEINRGILGSFMEVERESVRELGEFSNICRCDDYTSSLDLVISLRSRTDMDLELLPLEFSSMKTLTLE